MIEGSVRARDRAALANAALALEPCRPCEEHARLVMAWRNDPQTLAVSFHREAKTWPAFWLEFRDAYFREPNLPPLFLCADSQPVAFLRHRCAAHPTDPARATVDVSINVAPAARGQGIGRCALLLDAEHLRQSTAIDCILAEIRVDNAASRAVFAAAGYRLLDEAEKRVDDTGEICRIARYLRPL